MRRFTTTFASLVAAVCAFLVALSLAGFQNAVVQAQPPPPSVTPIEPSLTPLTPPATTPAPPTDTPVPPTNTPVPPTNTPVPPTNTPVPPTNTPVPPTNTPVPPTNTPVPTEVSPSKTPTNPPSRPPATPRPDPNCQSVVEGSVLDAASKGVQGATVSIEGAGWSKTMLTDDNGHYGFGGLCPGTAVLRAALPGGRVSSTVTVELDGKKHLYFDLTLSPAGSAVPTQVAATATRSAAYPTATGEPNMPATGYEGWLLVGGAILGSLLLFTAGMRRVLGSRDRPGGRQ